MKSGFLLNDNNRENPNLGPLQDPRSRCRFQWGNIPIQSNSDRSSSNGWSNSSSSVTNGWGSSSSSGGNGWGALSRSTNSGEGNAAVSGGTEWGDSSFSQSNATTNMDIWGPAVGTNTMNRFPSTGYGPIGPRGDSAIGKEFKQEVHSFFSERGETFGPMVLESSVKAKETSNATTKQPPAQNTATVVAPPNSTPRNENPYTNMPNLPHKTAGVPKNALAAYYGKKYKGQVVTNSQYSTRHNKDQPHLLKWTCVFTCPRTREAFVSGKYGDPANYEEKDGHVWYHKKIQAEHGAAARALDSFMWRDLEGRGDSAVWRLCVEEPYGDIVKGVVMEEPQQAGGDTPMSEGERDDMQYRDEYRNARMGATH
mmetsp:Transcript_11727/g.14576  ORF Transcript_11727/g.14576 Transcript_11727/m.14576 type:complete len:368 (+) Transcript_11727:49-1152(+)|eukprot:CAMPEP_0172496650 /NCGR_PEP_ID=MMETSP1066-20121228/90783_1 /TAXON_ID=671091 /ORGANISM="Coscinodiscus wailesii, Strain CCMP2513" /LENGTH=367 /DNA_ID=CAMNT_0013269049 /DNA_START=49 /DNA_END=1152 /DNA_ORIENTATION=+